jgi:hypothetical protein
MRFFVTDADINKFSHADMAALLDRHAELIAAGEMLDMVRLPTVDGLPTPDNLFAMVIPKGKELKSVKPLLREYMTRPERITNAATLTSMESFRDYLLRFLRPETAVFVTVGESPALTAIFDYHGLGAEAEPSFCTHTASYRFPLSEPFRAWLAAGKGLMDQGAFATFLQEREYDIEAPPVDWRLIPGDELQAVLDLLNIRPDPGAADARDPAMLPAVGSVVVGEEQERPRTALEKLCALRFGRLRDLNALARGVEITVGQKFTQGSDPRTGARTLTFAEEHGGATDRAGVKLTIPELFLIYVPVFDGGPRQLLPVRLFYRAKGGGLLWGVQIIDPLRMIRRAVDAGAESLRHLAEGVSVPVLYGDPGRAAA